MRMTFGEFLSSTKAHSNPEGDFVRDARDDEFLSGIAPHDHWTLVADHLYRAGACHEAITAGKAVWRRYRRWIRRHIPATPTERDSDSC